MVPVEVTTKYVTTVDDLPGAWSFVMSKLEKVGPDPHVEIKPLWQIDYPDLPRIDDPGPTSVRRFEVLVEGMVEENA